MGESTVMSEPKPVKKRIVYIDYLKGLTILWVVWYHTVHPEFVEFSFRIPLFFFVSGIFFRPYGFMTFLKKKVNTLLVPFVLFYLIYYLYYICLWVVSGRDISTFDFSTIFSLFGLYKGHASFVINPPLWFIFALVNLQFLLYFLVRISIPKIWIAVVAVAISLADILWFYDVPTLFMWGRCLRYFAFYSFGYLYGKELLSVIECEKGRIASLLTGLTGFVVFLVCWQLKPLAEAGTLLVEMVNYIEIFALILFMVYLLKYISPLPALRFLKFYGQNSYIVLGMHEIILTLLLLTYHRVIGGTPDVIGGIVMLVATTLLLYPIILLFNRVCPKLIGKNELWK